MKKNWLIFVVVVISAYGWLLYDNASRSAAYAEAKAQYEAEWEVWKQERDRKRAEQQEVLQQLTAGITDPADPDAVAPDQQAEGDGTPPSRPSISQGSDAQPLRQISVKTLPRHTVDTPLYQVVFSELGAKPVDWRIKTSEFVTNVATKDDRVTTTTIQIIPQVGDFESREFPLELTGVTARDFNTVPFKLERREVEDGEVLRFQSVPFHDLVVVKEYRFRRDSYRVDLAVSYINGPTTRKDLGRERGYGIGWQGGIEDPAPSDRTHGEETFVGSTNEELETRTLRRGASHIELDSPFDWGGVEKKFFTALIVPQPENPFNNALITIRTQNDAVQYNARGMSPPLSVDLHHPKETLEPGDVRTVNYQIYVGPRSLDALKIAEFNLGENALSPTSLVFHWIPLKMNWLRPVCLLLLKLLKFLEDFLGSWGVAVIGTTIIVRTLVYPLTHWAMKNQIRTMLEQKKIKPELARITKKYAKDPMKRNQAVMQLYRDHNVNPLGFMRGCFPILLQMPIFLGLYVVFDQSVELRGKSFLWIEDLSAPDRFFVWGANVPLLGDAFHLLPLLMSITNYLQMKVMHMPAGDEMQEKIQKQMQIMMPIMFFFFLYSLPSGLILYWVVSNCWGVAQSVITKRLMAAHEARENDSSGGTLAAAT